MKRSEKGFTLIELAVVMAIVAVVAIGANVSIFQVIKGTERSNDHTTAVRQVQNAGYWIGHDTLMAKNVIVGDDPETTEYEFITLNWTDWENGDVHKIVYTFHDMAGGLKELKRQHLTHDVDGFEIGNDVTFIAKYIDGSASFSEQDGVWKLTIQASPGTQTEAREYEIDPRVNIL